MGELAFLLVLLVLMLGVGEWFVETLGEVIADVIGFGSKDRLPPMWLAILWYLTVGAVAGGWQTGCTGASGTCA